MGTTHARWLSSHSPRWAAGKRQSARLSGDGACSAGMPTSMCPPARRRSASRPSHAGTADDRCSAEAEDSPTRSVAIAVTSWRILLGLAPAALLDAPSR